jgi:hypothetical protein
MSSSITNSLLANTVTGNADAINGLTPGTTTPNPSTRTAFQQAVALLNSPSNINLNGESSSQSASINLNSSASTVTGVTDTSNNNFNGSSAITGANVLGLSNSDIKVGQNVFVDASAASPVLGNITASGSGIANSTASTTTGTSAAAVVDVAGAGLFNSFVDIGRSVNNLDFTSRLKGTATASGVTVGSPTPAGTNPTTALDGSDVNSILNLNARGISGQNQYFQEPISPFFAAFSGLPTAPTTITSVPSGSGNANGNTIEVGVNGNVNATATALGSSTSSNVTGDSNSFAGIFSSGATLIDDITIGQDGSVSGTSNLGYDPAITDNTATQVDERIVPISTSSSTTTGSSSAVANLLSIGVGTAAVRAATSSPNGVAPAVIGIGQNGDITGTARNYASTTAKTTTGDAVSFTGGLTGSGGNTFASSFNPGNALTVGLFNLDMTGVGHNNVTGEARSGVANEASTVTGDATVRSVGITAGIFGNDTQSGVASPANTDLKIVNGDVKGIAQAVNIVKANTITGNASATINTTAVGIGNTNITIAGSGSINASASLVGLAGTSDPAV